MIDLDAYKPFAGPYEAWLYLPTHDCPHGNGDNCECKLPRFHGLFVAPIPSSHDGKVRHVVVRMRMVHDGGMVAFDDPVSDEVVGCMGINTMHTSVVTTFAFVRDHMFG